MLTRNLGDVLGPHIEQPEQGQANRVPQRMTQHQRDRHPNMTIQELLIGWSRRRIVMNAGPLDVRPIPFGGRIVHGQQYPFAGDQPQQQQTQQPLGQLFGLASQGLEEVVIVGEVVGNPHGSQPGGDRPSSPGKEHPQENQRQPPAIATMQPGGQPLHPLLPILWRLIVNHPWLSHRAASSATAA